MKTPIRLIAGIIYFLVNRVVLLIACVYCIIWYFSFKQAKEMYREQTSAFYVSYLFHSLERWRYNTLADFVFDRKDYSKNYFKQE